MHFDVARGTKKKLIVVSDIFWCNFHNCLEHPPSWNSQPIYRWLKFPVWIVQCRKSVRKKFRPFTSSPIVLSSNRIFHLPLCLCPSITFKWLGLKKFCKYWTIFGQWNETCFSPEQNSISLVLLMIESDSPKICFEWVIIISMTCNVMVAGCGPHPLSSHRPSLSWLGFAGGK